MRLSSLIPFRTAGWSPAKCLREIETHLGKYLVEHALLRQRTEEESMELPDWSPEVDVSEDTFQYLVTVDLPGVQKEEVKVTVVSGKLVVSGVRRCDKDPAVWKLHRTERKCGRFSRTFRLPDAVMDRNVNAEMAEGVLTIHLPKGDTSRPMVTQVSIT